MTLTPDIHQNSDGSHEVKKKISSYIYTGEKPKKLKEYGYTEEIIPLKFINGIPVPSELLEDN